MEWIRDTYWQIAGWMEHPAILASSIVVGSFLVAYVVEYTMRKTVGAMAAKTKTSLDDTIVAALRRPVFVSVVLIGLAWAGRVILPFRMVGPTTSVLETIAVYIWATGGFKIGAALLQSLSRRRGIVQPRTLPVFEMLIKILIVGAAIYFTFLSWNIDVTAWMASAGIIGIAIGFAAKDTLANLFSGIFILADAPYKVGDWIVLDDGLRGKVTRIGMRSTRVLTREDVEITIPNAVIGNSKIINEAGGPYIKQRIAIEVSAAYGTDIDKVAEVLLECPKDIPGVCDYPAPETRFRAMGASGLDFQLLVWIEDPSRKGRVTDRLNGAVYKAFYANEIEIPFPQRDVHIRTLPDALADKITPTG